MMPSVVVRGAMGVVIVALLAACGQTVPHAASSQVLPVADVQATPTAAPVPPTAAPTDVAISERARGATAQPAPTPAAERTEPVPEPDGETPSEASEPPAGSSDPGSALWDHTYRSTAVHENGSPRPLVDGTPLKLRFEQRRGGVVSAWRSACNWTGADVSATDTRLDFTLGGATAVGCSQERHQQDEWFDAFFAEDPSWELRGDRLTLAAGDVVIQLREAY